MKHNVSLCRFCQAQLIFIPTAKGNLMPCENRLVSVEELNDKEIIFDENGKMHRKSLSPNKSFIMNASVSGYRPHWPNCVGADSARNSSWRPK